MSAPKGRLCPCGCNQPAKPRDPGYGQRLTIFGKSGYWRRACIERLKKEYARKSNPGRKRRNVDGWKAGDIAIFYGQDINGLYNGIGKVTIVNPHANAGLVTHVDSSGREYEGSHTHIRTAIIKTSRGKEYEVNTFYLRPRQSNPGRRKHSAKWDRCVVDVRRKGGAAVPEAVCTKVLGSRAYNPRDPEMARAARLYEGFREKTPKRIKRVEFAPPRIAVDIGYVEYIGYRTTHGKKLTLYQHDFAPGSRPLLCVSPDGRQLLLLGGRYKFTDRGIVDRDIDDREIENPEHGEPL